MHGLPDLKKQAVTVLRFAGWHEDDIATVMGGPDQRSARITAMYGEGATLEEIGAHLGISRERVRQILRKSNVSRTDGGQYLNSQKMAAEAAARRDAKAMRIHGCTHAQYQALLAMQRECGMYERGPVRAFKSQRQNARRRGIPWKLKQWEWWTIWQESGKWELRGRGAGKFCMARNGDAGPYAIGNVRICDNTENIEESYETSPAQARAELRMQRMDKQEGPRQLTLREQQVVGLIKDGFTPREIAEHLGIQRNTASNYVCTLSKRALHSEPA